MSDIATISLRVNTAELERGNKALDDFQQTAGSAANKADDLNSVFRAGADSQKKNTQSLKEQKEELQALLNKISLLTGQWMSWKRCKANWLAFAVRDCSVMRITAGLAQCWIPPAINYFRSWKQRPPKGRSD